MIARSGSWRKKADSNAADSIVLEGGQIRFRQKLSAFFNFAKFQYAPRCHRPALRLRRR